MPASYSFHPEALFEYEAATNYYFLKASPRVAEAFITAVESAVAALVADPERYRVVEEPDIRRCSLTRFPFVIYYHWDARHHQVAIYAIMHCSREPGYWHSRLEQ